MQPGDERLANCTDGVAAGPEVARKSWQCLDPTVIPGFGGKAGHCPRRFERGPRLLRAAGGPHACKPVKHPDKDTGFSHLNHFN